MQSLLRRTSSTAAVATRRLSPRCAQRQHSGHRLTPSCCHRWRSFADEASNSVTESAATTATTTLTAKRGKYIVRFGPEGRVATKAEQVQAKITQRVAGKHSEGAPVSEMTRDDLARMIADINVAVAMNARKLQQIQDFEKKAFGKVTADSFHTTLLNIEATLVPIVSFVQRGINTPVFGYHIINKYTIVGAIVAIVVAFWWWEGNKGAVYQNVGEELAQITSQAISDIELVRTVQGVLHDIARDPSTIKSLVDLLETAMAEEATQRSVTNLVNHVLQDETVRQNLVQLLWAVYQDKMLVAATGQFLLHALQTPTFLEGINFETNRLVMKLLRDDQLQAQLGIMLNRSVKFAVLPGFLQPNPLSPAELAKVRAESDIVALASWEARQKMIQMAQESPNAKKDSTINSVNVEAGGTVVTTQTHTEQRLDPPKLQASKT